MLPTHLKWVFYKLNHNIKLIKGRYLVNAFCVIIFDLVNFLSLCLCANINKFVKGILSCEQVIEVVKLINVISRLMPRLSWCSFCVAYLILIVSNIMQTTNYWKKSELPWCHLMNPIHYRCSLCEQFELHSIIMCNFEIVFHCCDQRRSISSIVWQSMFFFLRHLFAKLSEWLCMVIAINIHA